MEYISVVINGLCIYLLSWVIRFKGVRHRTFLKHVYLGFYEFPVHNLLQKHWWALSAGACQVLYLYVIPKSFYGPKCGVGIDEFLRLYWRQLFIKKIPLNCTHVFIFYILYWGLMGGSTYSPIEVTLHVFQSSIKLHFGIKRSARKL